MSDPEQAAREARAREFAAKGRDAGHIGVYEWRIPMDGIAFAAAFAAAEVERERKTARIEAENSHDAWVVLSAARDDLAAALAEERAKREAAEHNDDLGMGCFQMIAETLTAHGYAVELKSTPPMFLNNAVHNALAAKNRELETLRADLARVTAERDALRLALDDADEKFRSLGRVR